MNSANINKLIFAMYAVLKSSMMSRREGTILDVTSVTSLDVPLSLVKQSITQMKLPRNRSPTPFAMSSREPISASLLCVRKSWQRTFTPLRVGHNKEMYERFLILPW
ncbi:hypothetical protein BDW66DRAFT_132431 [Aspergillus desertorum]